VRNRPQTDFFGDRELEIFLIKKRQENHFELLLCAFILIHLLTKRETIPRIKHCIYNNNNNITTTTTTTTTTLTEMSGNGHDRIQGMAEGLLLLVIFLVVSTLVLFTRFVLNMKHSSLAPIRLNKTKRQKDEHTEKFILVSRATRETKMLHT
jgi:hypothetical protein